MKVKDLYFSLRYWFFFWLLECAFVQWLDNVSFKGDVFVWHSYEEKNSLQNWVSVNNSIRSMYAISRKCLSWLKILYVNSLAKTVAFRKHISLWVLNYWFFVRVCSEHMNAFLWVGSGSPEIRSGRCVELEEWEGEKLWKGLNLLKKGASLITCRAILYLPLKIHC